MSSATPHDARASRGVGEIRAGTPSSFDAWNNARASVWLENNTYPLMLDAPSSFKRL